MFLRSSRTPAAINSRLFLLPWKYFRFIWKTREALAAAVSTGVVNTLAASAASAGAGSNHIHFLLRFLDNGAAAAAAAATPVPSSQDV
jgi:hypothetical protein